MADQEDQHSDPPAENSTHLPFKKRHVSERTLPRLIGDTKTTSSETEKVTAAEEQKGQPVKLRLKQESPDVKAEPSSTTREDSPIPSWGDVSPASLVNKWVTIRITMTGEDDYVTFLIADYDAETEMHQLVTAQSKKELKDPCTWIDIRHFSGEDIVWQAGNPGFPTRKCFLKPGQTLLHATSTAREKKQIKEVRKAASQISNKLHYLQGCSSLDCSQLLSSVHPTDR